MLRLHCLRVHADQLRLRTPLVLWALGYFVSTVGIEEDVIKRYVKHQKKEEKLAEEQQHKFDFESFENFV